MRVTQAKLDRARQLALENYETWGDRVIECMSTKELTASLEQSATMREWIRDHKIVADIIADRRGYFDRRENYQD